MSHFSCYVYSEFNIHYCHDSVTHIHISENLNMELCILLLLYSAVSTSNEMESGDVESRKLEALTLVIIVSK